MTFEEYRKQAMATKMPSCHNTCYMLMNLVGEVGELCGKMAKQIRHGNYSFFNNSLRCNKPESIDNVDITRSFKHEAGDILWQWFGLCEVMGWDPEDIARMNLEKLRARQNAGTIDGCGDGVDGTERAAMK